MASKVKSTTIPSSTTCPWGKQVSSTPPVRSFTDVMDEEYAQQLQNEDINKANEPLSEAVEQIGKIGIGNSTSETANDLLLAQMLQLEFYRENDEYIQSLEKHYNGTSKVSMSFKNFRSLHPYEAEQFQCNNDNESDEEDGLEEEFRRRQNAVGKVNPGEEIVTKHDSVLSERKNAKNVELFPINFALGDVGKKDIRLPNHVYNKLKIHSVKEERNEMRLHEKKEHSTHVQALDENTRLILYRMVNNGTLETISCIISTGKEAVVMHAKGGVLDGKELPTECALKIFKTTLNEFKTREKYIKDDHRFHDRFAKQNPRKIIRLWAEKEYRNLTRMQDAGINCPQPLCLRKHIIVMSFVGFNQLPAQKLKDAVLNKDQLDDAYQQCITNMKSLYEKCNLIHADLSEYNILWNDSKCYFIDVSQSVEPIHPHAYHFLLRDCRNITNFFTKAGLTMIMKEDELFTYICGKKLEITSLDEIEKECTTQFEKDAEFLTFGIDTTKYNFDYHFEQAQNEKSDQVPGKE